MKYLTTIAGGRSGSRSHGGAFSCVSALLERVAPAEPCCFGATEGSVEQQQQWGVFEALRQVHFAALCSSTANPTSEQKKAHLNRTEQKRSTRSEACEL